MNLVVSEKDAYVIISHKMNARRWYNNCGSACSKQFGQKKKKNQSKKKTKSTENKKRIEFLSVTGIGIVRIIEEVETEILGKTKIESQGLINMGLESELHELLYTVSELHWGRSWRRWLLHFPFHSLCLC